MTRRQDTNARKCCNFGLKQVLTGGIEVAYLSGTSLQSASAAGRGVASLEATPAFFPRHARKEAAS